MSFTLTAPTTLLFVIPDNILGDNTGGVSVVITAVPEPRSAELTIAGLLVVGGLGMRRSRAARGAAGR